MAIRPTPPVEEYDRVFALEQSQDYPTIDAVEAAYGFALDRTKLEAAARVLACPVKAHPPNWQHGRVLYAAARRRLASLPVDQAVTILDIGTAKGFSALCLLWALTDAGRAGTVISVDVIDPKAREQRNTVAECDGLKTLAETLEPWPEAAAIHFKQREGVKWLETNKAQLPIAFVDGKHKYTVVSREGQLIARRQSTGDVIVFDDCHIESLALAARELASAYSMQLIKAHEHRAYIVAVRK